MTDLYARLARIFGAPSNLAQSSCPLADLASLGEQGGFGTWGDGLFTLRCDAPDLYGWERSVEADACFFGYSAFGTLFFAGPRGAQLVDTQQGLLWGGPATAAEFLVGLAEPESRTKILREPLFTAWKGRNGPLGSNQVLCPVPAIPLGGSWERGQLSVVTFEVYLSIMAQAVLE